MNECLKKVKLIISLLFFSCKNEVQKNSSLVPEGEQSKHGVQNLARNSSRVTQITQTPSQPGWRFWVLFRLAPRSAWETEISGHGTQEGKWSGPNIHFTLGQKQGNLDNQKLGYNFKLFLPKSIFDHWSNTHMRLNVILNLLTLWYLWI